jgi:hypothetical protein
MRGPAGVPVGTLKRIIISNVVSYNSSSRFGGAGHISGIPDHPIEDIKIHDLYMEHIGGGTKEMADRVVGEQEKGYPEPYKMGDIPASGFYVRHVNNIEFSNVEIAWNKPDARPVFFLNNVNGAEFFRIKTPKNLIAPLFAINKSEDVRMTSSRNIKDTYLESVDHKMI